MAKLLGDLLPLLGQVLQQGEEAWSAAALRVVSVFGADPAGVLWGLGGGCVGVLRLLGGLWVGVECV